MPSASSGAREAMPFGALQAVALDVASDDQLEVGVEHVGFSSVIRPIAVGSVWGTTGPLPARR